MSHRTQPEFLYTWAVPSQPGKVHFLISCTASGSSRFSRLLEKSRCFIVRYIMLYIPAVLFLALVTVIRSRGTNSNVGAVLLQPTDIFVRPSSSKEQLTFVSILCILLVRGSLHCKFWIEKEG